MKIIEITEDFADESYSLFDASGLQVGDTVSDDIYIKRSDKYIIIIEAGTVLTQKLYTALQTHSTLYVLNKAKKHTHISDNIKKVNCKTLLIRIKRDKKDSAKTLQLLYDAVQKLFADYLDNKDNKIDQLCTVSIIESIIFLFRNNNSYLKNIMPMMHNDHKLPVHSLNVTVYALHLGYILNLNDEQLLKLGQAALLHDIGKKRVTYIIDKSSELNKEELEQIYKRVEHSLQILRENNINDTLIIDAVKHHQERFDGSGYPNGLKQYEISDFGAIIAICDVFDALTTDRPYRKRYGTFEALKIMMQDPSMKNKFNNDYLKRGLISIT
ncbi:HD domain-containing phosphohydrolase [Sulfurimonas sp. HSL3-2]|uniref:HD-GYP domain-containing protein n=1 Tax=Hydrocurvibacter mobilis TaxID=3131936 RepID=UPI0031F8A5C6